MKMNCTSGDNIEETKFLQCIGMIFPLIWPASLVFIDDASADEF